MPICVTYDSWDCRTVENGWRNKLYLINRLVRGAWWEETQEACVSWGYVACFHVCPRVVLCQLGLTFIRDHTCDKLMSCQICTWVERGPSVFLANICYSIDEGTVYGLLHTSRCNGDWYNSVGGFLWLVSSQVKNSCTNQMGCDGLMGQVRHMVHGRTHGFASSFLPSYYGLWKIIIRTK